MRPEYNSRRLFGITRAKGKMYELGLPEESHLAVPEIDDPEALLLLTVGTLGDAAADLCEAEYSNSPLPVNTVDELNFSASFFDAFLASKFSEEMSDDVLLLAASAYYLARRPGSSLVLARRLKTLVDEAPVDELLRWVLQAQWSRYPTPKHPYFGEILASVAKHLAFHFYDGSGVEKLKIELTNLRELAYAGAGPRDLLFVDIITAIIRMRLATSAWTTLPSFTQIPREQWEAVLRRPNFPKELWPSQVLLGQAGFFSGGSGVIQMPTSAGKTRSVEIILRSGFLSGRASFAIVVAPFRALCHEIGTSLRHAFMRDDIKVNELSDALQMDFLEQIAELFGSEAPVSKYVLVLTPEKLLYVLRQAPALANNIGIIVYDEGHQFDSGSRGITYELLLTEIKTLLPQDVQTVLISAVIRNAHAVGQWLIGDLAHILNGSDLLPTARSVAFATWLELRGQLMFYESLSFHHPDYFVPRAIEQQQLKRFSLSEKERYFPEKGKDAWKDVSLYLGIRLASKGAVAIFCGRKSTASGLAERVVEVYRRGYQIAPPASFSNINEVRKLKNLIDSHFGPESTQSFAASLGVFVHHGNTPHGLRLSVEHAMQNDLIKLVVCTSTLAQGVNLPIRYLIVSGIYQAKERIKTRDFQNLIGRAGRAGMHTEGLVIFADPKVYDYKNIDRWMFKMSVDLLVPENAEDTTSSLLDVITPFKGDKSKHLLPINPAELSQLLLDENYWQTWANNNQGVHFSEKTLIAQLRRRRKQLSAVESYLMANRGSEPFEEFRARVQRLAEATLAYHLASETDRSALVLLFDRLANYVESQAPDPERQAIYAKTLLGVASAKRIEKWVDHHHEELLRLETNEQWLLMTWPLFSLLSEDKLFHGVDPTELPLQIALLWLKGSNYRELIEHTVKEKGTKPWGKIQRRRLTSEEVINFCENTLAFECSLVLAAVVQFLFGDRAPYIQDAAVVTLFQKALKYGLPDQLSISSYEQGFADRAIAQTLRDGLLSVGYTNTSIKPALSTYRDLIVQILADFPTYFESLLEGLE